MHATQARHREAIYALMRFMLGALFVCHGAQKLFGAFGGPSADKGLMVAGGMTRGAAFLASGMMAVAYFMSHAPKGFWPIVNGGEKAVLYCFAFLFVAAYGGGIYSLDAVVRRANAVPDDTGVRRHVAAAAPRV